MSKFKSPHCLTIKRPDELLRGFKMPQGLHQQFLFGPPTGNRIIMIDDLLKTGLAPRGRQKESEYLRTIVEKLIQKPSSARKDYCCLVDILALLKVYPHLSGRRQTAFRGKTWYAIAGTTTTTTSSGILYDVPFFEVDKEGKGMVKYASVTVPIGDDDRVLQNQN